MRKYQLISFAFALLLLLGGSATAAEYVSVPAEGRATSNTEDFAAARASAINVAFARACSLAMTGLASPETLAANSTLISTQIIRRADKYVASYKLLDEEIDLASSAVTVKLQVTLFLDDMRATLSQSGVSVKKRPLPSLVVIIEERNAEFYGNADFLILNSQSEDQLSVAFEERGYAVANRIDIRRRNMNSVAISAFKGDANAQAVMQRTFESDLFLFGVTDVSVQNAGQSSDVTVTMTATLYGANGRPLNRYEGRAAGSYFDSLGGSHELIKEATDQIIRNLTVETPRLWKEAQQR
jgi:hypothetical protein